MTSPLNPLPPPKYPNKNEILYAPTPIPKCAPIDPPPTSSPIVTPPPPALTPDHFPQVYQ